MRAVLMLLLAVLVSCGGEPKNAGGGTAPVTFRVISEGQNPAFCVEGPEFVVARDEDAWIAAWDMQTGCQPQQEVEVPPVNFRREVGVAAWWKVVPCLGHDVGTTAVRRDSNGIVIEAKTRSPSPGTVCAQARAGLESFLALRISNADGVPVRFVLDGKTVGRVE